MIDKRPHCAVPATQERFLNQCPINSAPRVMLLNTIPENFKISHLLGRDFHSFYKEIRNLVLRLKGNSIKRPSSGRIFHKTGQDGLLDGQGVCTERLRVVRVGIKTIRSELKLCELVSYELKSYELISYEPTSYQLISNQLQRLILPGTWYQNKFHLASYELLRCQLIDYELIKSPPAARGHG